MLNIIRRVRKIHPYSNPQPLLVHCSAGVGRTGTFIVLDTMLKRMKSEKSLNILEFVQQLREERTFMVQSLVKFNDGVLNQ
jgi:protein tyrosine phosphatase